MSAKPAAANIDEYLVTLPEDARATIEELRRLIKAAAPDAVESISYGMPTFKYRGKRLIYVAAAKNHCALYGTSQGTLRFPHGELPPDELVTTLVNARIADIEAATAGRKKKKADDGTPVREAEPSRRRETPETDAI